jgi:hypothetical protein
MDLWVARELWHILDNPHFYLQQPEFLPIADAPETVLNIQPGDRQGMIRALKDWEYIRMTTDPANLNLFWIGDRPGESFLPSTADSQLIWRWEALACSLDLLVDGHSTTCDILTLAFRDTAALAAVLQSAFILTYQLPETRTTNLPPGICIALERWGIPCQAIDPLDAIAAMERDNFRHLLVRAGLSKLLWMGLHLAALHLVVPSASALCCGVERTQELFSCEGESNTDSTPNLWQGARGFWYPI